jgi:hypothetical protein
MDNEIPIDRANGSINFIHKRKKPEAVASGFWLPW